MFKLMDKFYMRLVVAVVFALLAASAFTGIQGPCTTTAPGENAATCVEFSKAITNPNDLLDNKQNSLVKFSKTFAIVLITSYALLSVYTWHQSKKTKLSNS